MIERLTLLYSHACNKIVPSLFHIGHQITSRSFRIGRVLGSSTIATRSSQIECLAVASGVRRRGAKGWQGVLSFSTNAFAGREAETEIAKEWWQSRTQTQSERWRSGAEPKLRCRSLVQVAIFGRRRRLPYVPLRFVFVNIMRDSQRGMSAVQTSLLRPALRLETRTATRRISLFVHLSHLLYEGSKASCGSSCGS